ncbi:MAG: 1,4-dihydroxy-2-naphthoate polyprenyltransferase [Myxococcota bacterium]|jgi:1,4-dihydroxy-2-naphthoate octaprenyltransferase|nr:1,4-dihydroxy-2-naphthoate polyprenyltransferase [Myxococcota bacterium]
MSAVAPTRAQVWWSAIRPKTLAAGAVPVAVGSALAAQAGAFDALPALAALLGALLLQIGSNLANDVFDFLKGADDDARLGPARATQRGWLSPRQTMAGAGVVFGLAVLVGLYLVSVGGWPIVAIGVAGIVCAVAYTGGPVPLGYRGLGDPLVFIFFGPVAVLGTYYVQVGAVSWLAAWVSASIGLLATAILVVNNLRDRHTDARAGKRTLAVRLGATGARREYVALIGLAYAIPTALAAVGLAGLGYLLPWLSSPLALQRVRAVVTLDGAALNAELAATARLTAVFGALLSVGVLL